jgi:hypothetical protein
VPKRRLLRIAVAVLALTLGTGATLQFWPFKGYVTQLNAKRITPGMTRAEVYDLLGGSGVRPDCHVGVREGEDPEFWYGWRCHIRVDFDHDERVIRADHRR